ncbi:S9 family peptidase [Sphingobacteriales bacterium CHB3]|nr:S9 family peptidase [Sphingobacteriales bacterium CHB3]
MKYHRWGAVPLVLLLIVPMLHAQRGASVRWSKDGNGYYTNDSTGIVLNSLPSQKRSVVVPQNALVPAGKDKPLALRNYFFSDDNRRLLIYTNTKRVWRYETRGDYWVLDIRAGKLRQLGEGLPPSSLMFAKFSPDGNSVAYVSERNVFVENVATDERRQLTQTDGSKKLINGTFDWAYEEELDCRDGFRWSPDGKRIAYWQVDANSVRDFLMINTTDSIYSFVIPVEYPKVGETPSPVRIGVVDAAGGATRWMNVPGDPHQQYIPRMEWAGTNELVLQILNRKQNATTLMYADATTGVCSAFYSEADTAWIDTKSNWNGGETTSWDWFNGGKEFLWGSEKNGWRQLYRIGRDGKTERLVTPDPFDLISLTHVDESTGFVYFIASPNNATQRYLYRVPLNGKQSAQRLSPPDQEGTHSYDISPNGKFALHSFSNYYTPTAREWISLPSHKPLEPDSAISRKISAEAKKNSNIEFFRITTDDGVEVDGWMAKPKNFDRSKKYPVLFLVYTEPAGQTVVNRWGMGRLPHYSGDLAEDGYIYMSLDNRGTPAPKGKAWRKAIYRKIGIVNIRDQAMAAKKVFEWPFIDTSRVAVWGHSGGGSATLNLLFQYPDMYKTGISMAAVTNQLTYDNIYQERFMGIPQENREDFINGSPVTYAKNFQGNLLYIHGTGDDNVHYQNAELLINEMVKHNKQFQFMPYPNRSHGIGEGEGTRKHISTLFTNFLRQHCPPGGR